MTRTLPTAIVMAVVLTWGNHAMAQAATPVHDGDEVALLPPVTGG